MPRRPETGGMATSAFGRRLSEYRYGPPKLWRVDLLVNNAGALPNVYIRGRLQRRGTNLAGILLPSLARSGKNASSESDCGQHFDSFVSQPIGVLPASLGTSPRVIGVGHSFARNRVADEGIRFNAIAPAS